MTPLLNNMITYGCYGCLFVFWGFPAFFGLNRLSVDCCYHAFLAKLL